ncbi:hypothetical protein BHE74_00037348 [Ensete ventricosum]|nr:hypothetical protein BHE74_00037348 [Ensete ventricosum]
MVSSIGAVSSPLSTDLSISIVVARYQALSIKGERKKREKKRVIWLETSTAFVAFFAEGRRCLLPSASLPITIDEEMETVFFSSSEATRRRGGDVA